MRAIALFCLGLGLAASTAAAQQTLVLRSGDRLTGSLSAIDGGTWVFVHTGGELKIAATDVASFASGGPIGIRLADGTVLAATVTTTGNRLQLAATDGTTRAVAATDLAAVGDPAALDALVPVRIGLFSPFQRFWSATTGAGFSNKTGNSRNRGLTAELEFGRRTPKDRLSFKIGVAREESAVDPDGSLATTVEKYYGSARADVFFGSRVFAFASTTQERDKFQDIDLRSNYNAGFGVQILSSDQTDLRFYSSGGVRREAFTSATSTESSAIIAAGTALRQAVGPAILSWKVDWAPAVEDLKDYRLVSEASITTSLIAGLGFRVASRNEVNNRPPSPGIRKHDWLLTSTLTYTIGR
jgi:putative salt-induced outer membrane protein YdiY